MNKQINYAHIIEDKFPHNDLTLARKSSLKFLKSYDAFYFKNYFQRDYFFQKRRYWNINIYSMYKIKNQINIPYYGFI